MSKNKNYKKKTHQRLKKCIKVTGSGRIFRRPVGQRHLNRKKRNKKKQWVEITGKQATKIKKMLNI